ncbi:MAG: GNAT family N-acetyltransferase [Caldilineaceae bacterium]|nr:GNAT family N-acetyltransferase [Caldilineaceae bacterium]
MHILLATERLILRRFTASDAEHIFALDNDPAVMRYINGGTPTPREIVEQQILPGFLRYDDAAPGFGFWAAEEKATGEFVGWFVFRPTDDNPGEVALGYRLHRMAWGKGYATEGGAALIRRGFGEWGVERVTATTYEENRASRRVMEKLGMRYIRSFRYSAEEIGASDTSYTQSAEVWPGEDVEYAISRAEWESRRAQEGLHIRPYRSADADAVSEIIRRTMRVSNSVDYPLEQLQPLIDYFSPAKVEQINRTRTCLVAEANGQLVATAGLEEDEVVTFFVLPEQQGRGIGSALLQQLEAYGRAQGIAELKLHASLTGAPFYARRGFQPTGDILNGTAGPQVSMRKQLGYEDAL